MKLPATPEIRYYVYKTTNTSNGKVYVGVHGSSDIDNDPYLGSGVFLRKAIERHGRESFRREILAGFQDPEDAYTLERALVDQEFVSRQDTYNYSLGGKGGFAGEHHPNFGKQLSGETLEKLKASAAERWSNPIERAKQSELRKAYSQTETGRDQLSSAAKTLWECPDYRKAKSRAAKAQWEDAEFREKMTELARSRTGEKNPFHGKSHSLETTKKMREAKRRQPLRVCPHCGKSGKPSGMTRFHFDNCKFKEVVECPR